MQAVERLAQRASSWLLGSGVEREPSKLEVVGSNPAAAFILFAFFGREEETEQRLG